MGKRKTRIGGYGKPGKLDIVFDEQARREYLTGFSKRKQERRRFGLAMQKVKDRKARLADREELRKAKQEAIEKLPPGPEELLLKGDGDAPAEPATVEFRDGFTTTRFGDAVTVTTFLGIPQAEEDEDRRDEEESRARKRRRNPEMVDREQEQAGSVERFKRLLVGKMPAKKKKTTKDNTSGSFAPKRGKAAAGGKEDKGEAAGGRRGKKGGKKGRR